MPSRAAVLALLLTAACSESETSSPTDLRPTSATGCAVSLFAVPSAISVPTQTTQSAVFTARNTCTTNSSWDITATRTGAVASVGSITPSAFFLGNGTRTVTVNFTTAATAGQGTVTLHATVGAPSATLTATENVTVTAGSGGIPFGLFGLKPDTVSPAIFTGGSLTDKNIVDVVTLLRAASAKGVHMWFNITGGENLFFTDSLHNDRSIDTTRWKAAFDASAAPLNVNGTGHWADSVQKYTQNGTLMGFILMDDIGNFNPDPAFAELEALGKHAKARYPGLVTALRAVPTLLRTISGTNGAYRQIDVGWAQYTAHGSVAPAQFRDDNIAAARQLTIGLVDGINITEGEGTGQNPLPVSPANLLSWGDTLLAAGTSDYVCDFMMWNNKYPNLTHQNMTTLSNLAASHVSSACKRH